MRGEIRPAGPADYVEVSRIASQGHALHVDGAPWFFQATPCAVGVEYFNELLAGEKTAVLVHEADGAVVGFVIARLDQAPAIDIFVPRVSVYISDVEVDEAVRGRGIGRALVDAAERWGRERGATSTELNVFAFNRRAVAFYESLGFVAYSQKMTRQLESIGEAPDDEHAGRAAQ